MLEVGAVDGKLVVCVELCLVGKVCGPGVGSNGFEDKHAVVDGRAVVRAVHVHLGRGRVAPRVGGEDDVPGAIELMKLGSPKVGRIVQTGRGREEDPRFRIVPFSGACQRLRYGTGWREGASARATHVRCWLRSRVTSSFVV